MGCRNEAAPASPQLDASQSPTCALPTKQDSRNANANRPGRHHTHDIHERPRHATRGDARTPMSQTKSAWLWEWSSQGFLRFMRSSAQSRTVPVCADCRESAPSDRTGAEPCRDALCSLRRIPGPEAGSPGSTAFLAAEVRCVSGRTLRARGPIPRRESRGCRGGPRRASSLRPPARSA